MVSKRKNEVHRQCLSAVVESLKQGEVFTARHVGRIIEQKVPGHHPNPRKYSVITGLIRRGLVVPESDERGNFRSGPKRKYKFIGNGFNYPLGDTITVALPLGFNGDVKAEMSCALAAGMDYGEAVSEALGKTLSKYYVKPQIVSSGKSAVSVKFQLERMRCQ